mmetsp:Transcript_5268/g.5409  ORF Transcript_5268/g.5409 Transcript_5268/m.5409 type:complete len:129 (-) Transcript_5268:84-470(-)|eukprot:CAMPEP_0182416818 /NCGR_PEP_ID=MMETSP1167-20130531/1190_1 /TAXON_ID=2988 /ORGANISM="Mallomonas Sp, Strain CCMP3275" /LENGTH=128 /DNA_ID=CAMNT_0024589917 /DNA_START=77 /DNA_END=463 /DNA_ORIENTATION=+
MSEASGKRVIKFRNYVPQDLPSSKTPSKKRELQTDTSNESGKKSRDSEILADRDDQSREVVVDILKRELELNSSEELKIVPKKPNWDLKQQIEKSLQKLQRRTQKAIVEILQEKLDEEQNTDEEENDD